MSRQLDILALEPYYGGIRRNMLQTLARCSRHRWTLMTLPPRRMERRLATAAHWFSEQIARRPVGPVDLLFTSDAMNLPDLHRLCPSVADLPSVVYFHSNQLPDAALAIDQQPQDLTNLSTATAATEVWINSKYHAAAFMQGIEELISVHRELQSRNPLEDLRAKLHLMPPPVDVNYFRELISQNRSTPAPDTERDSNTIFVETRDANIELLNAALAILQDSKHPIELMVTGPVDKLTDAFPKQVIAEADSTAQVRGLLTAGIFLSTKIAVPFDENAVRAMSLGCRPVLPHTGVYPELLATAMYEECLYDMSAESLAAHIHEAMYLPSLHRLEALTSRLQPFDAIKACAAIDARLDILAAARVAHSFPSRQHSLREARKRAIPNA
jgi:hypothetical protein